MLIAAAPLLLLTSSSNIEARHTNAEFFFDEGEHYIAGDTIRVRAEISSAIITGRLLTFQLFNADSSLVIRQEVFATPTISDGAETARITFIYESKATDFFPFAIRINELETRSAIGFIAPLPPSIAVSSSEFDNLAIESLFVVDAEGNYITDLNSYIFPYDTYILIWHRLDSVFEDISIGSTDTPLQQHVMQRDYTYKLHLYDVTFNKVSEELIIERPLEALENPKYTILVANPSGSTPLVLTRNTHVISTTGILVVELVRSVEDVDSLTAALSTYTALAASSPDLKNDTTNSWVADLGTFTRKAGSGLVQTTTAADASALGWPDEAIIATLAAQGEANWDMSAGIIVEDIPGMLEFSQGVVFRYQDTDDYWYTLIRGSEFETSSLVDTFNSHIVAGPRTAANVAVVVPDTLDNRNLCNSGSTVELWVRASSPDIFVNVINKGTSGFQINLELDSNTNKAYKVSLTKDFDGAADGEWETIDSVVTWNTWTHVAVTYDCALVTNDPGFSINGLLVASQEITTPIGSAVTDIGADICFPEGNSGDCASVGGALAGHNVAVDDVRIWGDIRSTAEIFTNYNVELTGSETDLANYFQLNEGVGATTANLTALTPVLATVKANTSWRAQEVKVPTYAWEVGHIVAGTNTLLGTGPLAVNRDDLINIHVQARDDDSLTIFAVRGDSNPDPLGTVDNVASNEHLFDATVISSLYSDLALKGLIVEYPQGFQTAKKFDANNKAFDYFSSIELEPTTIAASDTQILRASANPIIGVAASGEAFNLESNNLSLSSGEISSVTVSHSNPFIFTAFDEKEVTDTGTGATVLLDYAHERSRRLELGEFPGGAPGETKEQQLTLTSTRLDTRLVTRIVIWTVTTAYKVGDVRGLVSGLNMISGSIGMGSTAGHIAFSGLLVFIVAIIGLKIGTRLSLVASLALFTTLGVIGFIELWIILLAAIIVAGIGIPKYLAES